jgi:hypothetical protein
MIVEVPSYSCEFKGIREVAELIRCKECKYDGTWKCPWRNTQVPRYPSADDFCSYGERITNTKVEDKPTPIRDYMIYGKRSSK